MTDRNDPTEFSSGVQVSTVSLTPPEIRPGMWIVRATDDAPGTHRVENVWFEHGVFKIRAGGNVFVCADGDTVDVVD